MNRKTVFTDPKGIVTSYGYDERNLLVTQDYGAGAGKDMMVYDDLGQLVRKVDQKGQVIRFAYDEMGRNTLVKHYKSAVDEADVKDTKIAYTVQTQYDNRGNAVRISNANLIEYYSYNA